MSKHTLNDTCTAILVRDKQIGWCIASKLRGWARSRFVHGTVTRNGDDQKTIYVSQRVPQEVIRRTIENYQGVRLEYRA